MQSGQIDSDKISKLVDSKSFKSSQFTNSLKQLKSRLLQEKSPKNAPRAFDTEEDFPSPISQSQRVEKTKNKMKTDSGASFQNENGEDFSKNIDFARSHGQERLKFLKKISEKRKFDETRG